MEPTEDEGQHPPDTLVFDAKTPLDELKQLDAKELYFAVFAPEQTDIDAEELALLVPGTAEPYNPKYQAVDSLIKYLQRQSKYLQELAPEELKSLALKIHRFRRRASRDRQLALGIVPGSDESSVPLKREAYRQWIADNLVLIMDRAIKKGNVKDFNLATTNLIAIMGLKIENKHITTETTTKTEVDLTKLSSEELRTFLSLLEKVDDAEVIPVEAEVVPAEVVPAEVVPAEVIPVDPLKQLEELGI